MVAFWLLAAGMVLLAGAVVLFANFLMVARWLSLPITSSAPEAAADAAWSRLQRRLGRAL